MKYTFVVTTTCTPSKGNIPDYLFTISHNALKMALTFRFFEENKVSNEQRSISEMPFTKVKRGKKVQLNYKKYANPF